MTKERLSKLQKDILVILYKEGKQKDTITEYTEAEDKKRIVGLKKEDYKFGGKYNNPLMPKAELYFTKEITIYQLKREALLYKLNDWQKYNIYAEGYYGFGWRGRPKDYLKKQVSFTRSLRSLCGKRLIDLKSRFIGVISIYDKKLADKLGIEPIDFEKEKLEGIRKAKEKYRLVKEQNPSFYSNISFKKWWKNSGQRRLWKDWNCQRVGRNAKVIRLNPKGKVIAEKLLKLNTESTNHN